MADDIPLREHLAELRKADDKFQAERDRRLTEVAVEREKALKIKEEGDKAALQLAREIQTYKDEKANELREQINQERNLYASKQDVQNAVDRLEEIIKPLTDYMSGEKSLRTGLLTNRTTIYTVIGLTIAAITTILIVVIR